MNLLCLLSQNKVAEFHTELERLSSKELESVYIRHPVSMEQYIMEGSYNKVINLKGNVPAESYNFFFDILLKTVRNEIASCLEKVSFSFSFDSMVSSSLLCQAYKDIRRADAARMLSLSEADMTALASERGWRTEAGKFVFRGRVEDSRGQEDGVPSLDLAKMAISYAREMEQIV